MLIVYCYNQPIVLVIDGANIVIKIERAKGLGRLF